MGRIHIWPMRKNLIIILAVMLVIFLIGAYFVLKATGKLSSRADVISGPSLTLDPNSGSYDINSNFDININLNTAGLAASAVQINKIHFNPAVLQVVDADPSSDGIQIAKGNITNFEVTLANSADNSAGTIVYSVSSFTNNYTGNDILAKISFRTIAEATGSQVSWDFDGTLTTTTINDQNGANILAGVGPGAYDITNPTVPSPTVDLKIDGQDGTIAKDSGQQATLTWTSSNATACNASGNWTGPRQVTGSQSTDALTAPATYEITCTGDSGSISDYVSVSINGDATPPPSPTTSTTTSNTSSSGKKSAITAKPSLLTPTNNDKIASIPANIAKEKPQAKAALTLVAGVAMKPWALWFLYAIIPAFLAGGAIYIYLKRRASNRKSAI